MTATTRHCPTCEVGWTSTDTACWYCGRDGEIGDVRVKGPTWPPGHWSTMPRAVVA